MEFIIKTGQPEKQRTSCIIAAIQEPRVLSNTGAKLDALCDKALSHLLKRGDCDGKLGQTLLVPQATGISAERILLVGCGSQELNENQFRELIFKIITQLNEVNVSEAAICLNEFQVKNRDLYWKIQQTILVHSAITYRFEELKTRKTLLGKLRRFIFIVTTKKEATPAEQAVRQANATVNGMTLAKNLANLPANICTPSYLAEQAKKLAKNHNKISTAILEEKEMKSLGMGSFLSVARASSLPAKLITMEYRGTRKDVKPIVLVGKGITFDTGGNSLKMHPHMIGMKYDMCGAATVFGVIAAAVELELPLNVIGVIPTCENMIGPNATHPEDIVTSMSGLTIEILNTDAEGRLILADALTYCERFSPEVVIDIATLTGAAVLAFGPYASALMSNYEPLAHRLLQAGQNSSDRVWQLPLWEEYHDALKSEFADISNVPMTDIGARTIIAGCFLSRFAQKFHWAHLDVANTASVNAGPKRGATGRPIPLLVQYLVELCQKVA